MGELRLNNRSSLDYNIISEFIPNLIVPSRSAASATIYGQSGEHVVNISTLNAITRTYTLFLKYDVPHDVPAVAYDGIGSTYIVATLGAGNIPSTLYFPSDDPVRLQYHGPYTSDLNSSYWKSSTYAMNFMGKCIRPNEQATDGQWYYEAPSSLANAEFLIANANDALSIFQKFLGKPSSGPILLWDSNLDGGSSQYPRTKEAIYLGSTSVEDIHGQGAQVTVKFAINL